MKQQKCTGFPKSVAFLIEVFQRKKDEFISNEVSDAN